VTKRQRNDDWKYHVMFISIVLIWIFLFANTAYFIARGNDLCSNIEKRASIMEQSPINQMVLDIHDFNSLYVMLVVAFASGVYIYMFRKMQKKEVSREAFEGMLVAIIMMLLLTVVNDVTVLVGYLW
jgi:uncharacterized membrane protein